MRPFAIFMTCLLAAPAAATEIPVISQTIDFSDSGTLTAQIESLNGALPDDGKMVFLTLLISPDTSSGDPDYRVNGTSLTGQSEPVTCDEFGRLKKLFTRYDFSFNPDYNHLLLALEVDPGAVHPFMTIACQYNGTAAEPQLRFSGYFAVSTVAVPTAADVELRPVTPVIWR